MRQKKPSIPPFDKAFSDYVRFAGQYAGIAVPQLQEELSQLKRQVDEYKSQAIDKNGSLNNVLEATDRVIATSSGLLARVILPRQEEMSIQLVPAHLLDRLEEYRRDVGIYTIYIGVVSGAIAGILVNWATGGESAITLVSMILVLSFVVFDGLGCLRLWQISRRADAAKKRMFHLPLPLEPPDASAGTA
jgi:hypothetical protein